MKNDSERGSIVSIIPALFFASGCASLIYEVVWFQMLELVVGCAAVSLSILLAVFMGGLCLGSLALARFVPPSANPLRVYAVLELGIGLFGLAILILLPALTPWYVAMGGAGVLGLVMRGGLCGVCLLPPTLLMGATLPAVSRTVETTPSGMSWLGVCYAANILGAVAGCLLAGFYLLRLYGTATASLAAAAINAGVALVALNVPLDAPRLRGQRPVPRTEPSPRDPLPVYLAISLSGFCALAAEIAWTRVLALMLGATAYTFSIILAVFLAGLGIGSGIGAALARAGRVPPRRALGWCQILLCVSIAWAAVMLCQSLPYWPISPYLVRSGWTVFQLDLLRCAWAILPATLLWGASFPLALAAVAQDDRDPGALAGRVYAANTAGAIAGAVGCGILLLGSAGSQYVERLLVIVSASAGLIAWLPSRTVSNNAADRGIQLRTWFAWTRWALGTGVVALVCAWGIPQVPWQLIAYGRYLPTKTELGTRLFAAEGMNSSVAVTELSRGVRNFHVSGKIEASSDTQDMRLQRMLAHLPTMIHPEPRTVLVVGCGAGVTAGGFLVHPGIERVVVCEIEPQITGIAAQFFAEENYDLLSDPRVQVINDDARHFILTTREKFDIITSDPIHPWVKGAATLYTREYYELCRKHLKPGGLITQWVPLYESNFAVVKSELATFFGVFPAGTMWSNDELGEGYDMLLLGTSGEPARIDLDLIQSRLTSQPYIPVLASLRAVNIKSGFALLASYAGRAADIQPWLQGAEINTDRNLRLQYLAGLGLNFIQQDQIYSDLLVYRKFPGDLFTGSELQKEAIRTLIERPRSKK